MARKRKPQRREVEVRSSLPPQSTQPSARKTRRENALERSRSNKRERLLLLGVLAVTALAFVNALDGQFVYDDRFQILKNPTIKVDARNLYQNVVHTKLGLCYESLGRREEAKAEFQKAITVAAEDPSTETARERLAKLQVGA